MLIPAGYAQVNYRFGGIACPTGAECTLGLDVSGYAASYGQLAQDCADEWEATILLAQVADLTFESVLVKVGPNATGPSVELAISAAGTGPGDGAPPNTGALVRKVTAFGGRAGRGRMFIPGIDENMIAADGVMGGTNFTNLVTRVDAFFSGWNGYGITPVLLHTAGSPLSTPTEIVSWEVQARVATQRRRLRR